MRKTSFVQSLAVGLSLSLVVSSLPTQTFAESLTPHSLPRENSTWAPPEALGTVVDAYESHRAQAPRVIHIQDLHADYEVQSQIAKLLKFYDHRLNGQSYKVAVEGAEGPIWISQMAKIPNVSFRTRISDRLMKAAELTGSEYFAIVEGKPDLLWGVENEKYHKANLELFRSTFEGKEMLGDALADLENKLQHVKKKYYSRPLLQLDRQVADYHAGQLNVVDFMRQVMEASHRTGVKLAKYPEILKWQKAVPLESLDEDQFYTEQAALLREVQVRLAQSDLERNLVAAHQDVEWTKRFVREQVTTAELQHQAPQIQEILSRVKATLDASQIPYDAEALTQTISASLDFYAMALLRDQYLAENTLKLMHSKTQPHAPETVILISGGFHTPGITKLLKESQVSYVVVAPTLHHEVKSRDLYNQRLMGVHSTLPQLMSARMLSDFLNGAMFTRAWEFFQAQMRIEGIASPELAFAGMPQGYLSKDQNPVSGSSAGNDNPPLYEVSRIIGPIPVVRVEEISQILKLTIEQLSPEEQETFQGVYVGDARDFMHIEQPHIRQVYDRNKLQGKVRAQLGRFDPNEEVSLMVLRYQQYIAFALVRSNTPQAHIQIPFQPGRPVSSPKGEINVWTASFLTVATLGGAFLAAAFGISILIPFSLIMLAVGLLGYQYLQSRPINWPVRESIAAVGHIFQEKEEVQRQWVGRFETASDIVNAIVVQNQLLRGMETPRAKRLKKITYFVVANQFENYSLGQPGQQSDGILEGALATVYYPGAPARAQIMKLLSAYPSDQEFGLYIDEVPHVRTAKDKGTAEAYTAYVARIVPLSATFVEPKITQHERQRFLGLTEESGHFINSPLIAMGGFSLLILGVILGSASAVPVSISVLMSLSGTLLAIIPFAGELLRPLRDMREEARETDRLAVRLGRAFQVPNIHWVWHRVSEAAENAVERYQIAPREVARQRGKLALLIAA